MHPLFCTNSYSIVHYNFNKTGFKDTWLLCCFQTHTAGMASAHAVGATVSETVPLAYILYISYITFITGLRQSSLFIACKTGCQLFPLFLPSPLPDRPGKEK